MREPDRARVDGFDSYIDSLVLPIAIREAGHFDRILRVLPSVYPSQVLASIQRLGSAGFLPIQVVDRVVQLSQRPSVKRIPLDEVTSYLPVPHPLDYDWRFTGRTAQGLLTRCLDVAGPERDILLVGTPTVFAFGAAQGLADRLVLLDGSRATIEALQTELPGTRARHWVVGSPPDPSLEASVVLGDPPWYMSETKQFLWAASRNSLVGGTILMALAPHATRPGIDIEREEMTRFARALGLELLAIEENRLRYVSPLFERNALRAEGIHAIPHDWRRGDLAVFRKIEHRSRPRLRKSPQPARWADAKLLDCRLRVRVNPDERVFDDPRLQSLVDGDVLPTVSRRDRRRSDVDVWTCGNRVFRCPGSHLLIPMIEALERGGILHRAVARVIGRPLTANERNLVESAAETILSVATIESEEIRRLTRGGKGSVEVRRLANRRIAVDAVASGA